MYQRKRVSHRWYPVLAVILLFSLSCSALQGIFPWDKKSEDGSNPTYVDQNNQGSVMSASLDVENRGEGNGFVIQLSEGSSEPQEATPIEPVEGEPLTPEEVESILARMPEMPKEAQEQVEFNLPPEVLPPPRPGETISQDFPPEPEKMTAETVQPGVLEVLRYSPEGEISVAPFISVTFNQPMVPLGTLQQLAEIDIPVQVSPELPGTWRWVGTKTLTFNYDSDEIDRLPKATEYTVSIPAGTKSASGGELAQSVTWTFTTPPPVLTASYPYPYEPQPLEPLFFVAFDQRIDPEAVLETIKVTADGKDVAVRLADEDEIKEDLELSRLTEYTPKGRWLVFKAREALPKNSEIQVKIGPETPSAEGPLTTTTTQSYNFYTYSPLKIEDHGCSFYSDDCYPLVPFYIQFNNPLDTEKFLESMISISPPVAGATVNIFGNTITIKGITEGSTTYRVTVNSEITDIFGQRLGNDEKLTFKVGQAEPVLIGPNESFITVDPASKKPGVSIYTMNYTKVYVNVYAVEPSDWAAYKTFLREYARTDNPPNPPGRLVMDDTINLEAPSDVLTETLIDLSDVMEGDYGHFIMIIKPPKGFFEKERYWEHILTWVQVTQIGLDAIVDHSEMVAWATALEDGAPLSGITIRSDGDLSVTTGEDGLARFDIPNTGILYLTATKGKDVALLPRSSYTWSDDVWASRKVNDTLSWYVFDDRAMYKPGEEVHLKGWLRIVGGTQGGDVGLPGGRVQSVNYSVVDPQGNDIGSGSAEVDELGGFDFSFTIPENANLGYAQVYIEARGSLSQVDYTQYGHGFQIQEFRRPEFEVTTRNETTGPYFNGDYAITAVEAAYYAGGALPNAEVTWNVTSSTTNYQPPNWHGFVFGQWTPWWWYEYDMASYGSGGLYQSFMGRTDATGNHYLRIDFDDQGDPQPHIIQAESVVMDVNRQAWSSSTSLLVHPASLYVGMRTEKYFVERGDPLEIELIVVDLDGNPVVDRPIKVTAARMEWKYENGSWKENQVDPQECTVGSQEEPVCCTFETNIGGRYLITAEITDEMGRANQSQITRWVSGGQQPPAREVEQEIATLIPDQETYQPGETAKILVQSPFSPAEGLLTISRSGILSTERFTIVDGTTTLEIPIEEAHIPNLHVQVDLVGAATRMDDEGEPLQDVPDRPAYASGNLTLNVPPLSRQLSLEVTPEETQLSPGTETTIDVTLRDAAGKPVSEASLAVVVVDEAILALTNYQLTDPISIFYASRPSGTESKYARSNIILVDPLSLTSNVQQQVMATQTMARDVEEETVSEAFMMEAPAAPMAEESAMDMGTGKGAESEAQGITVRTDFNPLALFAPSERTDEQGKISIQVNLPDNLTRYRIMVVAVDESGKLFGTGESNLTARLPLMVRPSAPRFLNFGDQFDLPIVLQNQTDEEMTAEVVVETGNLELTGEQGLRVIIPANDRVEVRFPARTVMAGSAQFQVAAVSGVNSDAANISLPVYTPATTEAFAVYGVVDEGAIAQPLAKPEDVFPQFGGLEITTSSTALQALTDAVLYIVSYPYDCSEQIASRILGIAALRDVLSAFEAEGLPSPEAMEEALRADIEELTSLQNYDGGFPYWRRGNESIPYHTVHVAHALQRAREMDFYVSGNMWDKALNYLQYIENYYPYWYSEQARWTISAYALYVRDRMNDSDPAKAAALLEDAGLEQLSLDAIAWIWQVLAGETGYDDEVSSIRQHVNNRVVETAGAANFTTSYGDDDYVLLHSNRRTDALLLDAMIADNPQSDLIPKVVNGLLAHQTRGRWGNTQENVFVLLALDSYFDAYESQEPGFVARIWLGETYAGSSEFEGYSTDRYLIEVPMEYLLDAMETGEMQDLIVQKEGDGRLYYRLGLRYAPTDLQMPPVDMGFVVQRVYEAVDDPDDVRLGEDGAWYVKAGARVRVRVTMVADNRRYHVALVDPLPAGLEIINPALAVSENIPSDPNSQQVGWWWWWRWYQHQNLRDERVEAFTQLLWDGVYEYTYVARATTPGRFIVPPSKAEEMYSPEVFGRSAGDVMVIE